MDDSSNSTNSELLDILNKNRSNSNISEISNDSDVSGLSNLSTLVISNTPHNSPPRERDGKKAKIEGPRYGPSGLGKTFNIFDNDDHNPFMEDDLDAVDNMIGSDILNELFQEISHLYNDEEFETYIKSIIHEIKSALDMTPGSKKRFQIIRNDDDSTKTDNNDTEQYTQKEILKEIINILENAKDDNNRQLNLYKNDNNHDEDKKIKAYELRINLIEMLIKKCKNPKKRDLIEMKLGYYSTEPGNIGGKYKTKKNKKNKRKTKKQFLFNPNNPKKSFDVYIDKNPNDTINIKYTTVKDVENTIKKLERLYKQNKYPHKRIWQVGMILKVRLAAMKKNQKKYYPKAKNVTKRLKLSEKYFKFLSKRSREKDNKTRKRMKFKFN